MPFRFKLSDETVESGVRRLAREELDVALSLVRLREQSPERIVHRVRRSCKALRGLLRLIRPVFPAYPAENAAFRDIASALSVTRDKHVLVDTLDRLVNSISEIDDAVAITALRRGLATLHHEGHAPSVPIGPLLDQCVEPLEAARERAASWTIAQDDVGELHLGLNQTYRRAHRAMAEAIAAPDDPHLSHEWRKQVKYNEQHMRLLRGIAAEPAHERARLAGHLGDALGERHDLDLLTQVLTSSAADMADNAAIGRLADMARGRAAQLARSAETLGAGLFHDKPTNFAREWRGRLEGVALSV